MNHEEHVALIAGGIEAGSGGRWADFGSGEGAFTLALCELAGADVEIWSVDRDRWALDAQRAAFAQSFPGTDLHIVWDDFTKDLFFPPLDGIMAANALHYVREQASLLRRWRDYLKQGGRLILVEYDAAAANRWVPYPVSAARLPALAREAGFAEPREIGSRPSRFLRRLYAAVLTPVSY